MLAPWGLESVHQTTSRAEQSPYISKMLTRRHLQAIMTFHVTSTLNRERRPGTPDSVYTASLATIARVLAVFLLTALSASAQTVSGTVLDADGATLPGASVYLSGTTRGDASDRQGRFEIPDVAPGAYRIVASMVGFKAATQDIVITAGTDLEVDLVLEAGVSLGDVQVEAEIDDDWLRRFQRFRRAIVGESWRADSTRILNPEVLSFEERRGTLTAQAAAPLVIENRALGYRLVYDLSVFEARTDRIRFDGDERFETLESTTWRDTDRWRTARLDAYNGSGAHFFRSLLAGTIQEEGFSVGMVSADGRSLEPAPDDLMTTRDDGWGTLRASRLLIVSYFENEDPAYLWSEWFKEDRDVTRPIQRSGLEVDGNSALIDPQGTPEDPFAISASGYLAFERLADLVPEDYDPYGFDESDFTPTDF